MKTKDKVSFSMQNLEEALRKLNEFCIRPSHSEIERAGVIQAFEFTFEVAWKTLQKFAQEQGLSAASPKQAFQAAFKLGLISESEQAVWLDMMEDRNLTSHTYKRATADRVFEAVVGRYQKSLELLFERLSSAVVASRR